MKFKVILLSLPASIILAVYMIRINLSFASDSTEVMFFAQLIGVFCFAVSCFIANIKAKEISDNAAIIFGILLMFLVVIIEMFAFSIFMYQFVMPEIISLIITSFALIFCVSLLPKEMEIREENPNKS